MTRNTKPTATRTGRRQFEAHDRKVLEILEATLRFARERDYVGWDYGDGMSSRLRRLLPVEHKWVNIGFQELVKRAPVNVRPLLLVEQRRNFMGGALFAMANLTVDGLVDSLHSDAGRSVDSDAGRSVDSDAGRSVDSDAGRSVDYREEALTLADWLVEERTRGYSGFCLGYPHPIQHLDGRGDPREPDIVNTSFGVKALLRAGDVDDSYPPVARSAADFVTEDLNYESLDAGRGAVVDYHTKHPQEYYTINAGALGARLFLDLYDHFEEPSLADRAMELLDHIGDLQTDLGGWKYRDPPDASHLSMDTHHNGFIIEAFQRYEEVLGDDRYDETLQRALAFYETCFEADGAPRFDESSAYPRDIHASTQGVLVFTYAGDLDTARRILEWVFGNLYAGGGRFYVRRERHHTRRQTLMRWCEAWMAFAMSEYLDARSTYGDGALPDRS